LDRCVAVLDNAESGPRARSVRDPEALRALAAFGAFTSGTITPELLASHLGVTVERAISALCALVDLSLARRSDPLARCYAIHDSTMWYARTVLHGDEVGIEVRIDTVRRFLASFAERDHTVVARDLVNVLAVADRARGTSVDDFLFIAETVATCGFVDTHGHSGELLRVIDAAIEMARGSSDTDRQHRLLGKRGNTCYNQGDLRDAIQFYEQALDTAPNPRRRAIVLAVLGKVYADVGEVERAKDCLRRANAIADDNDDDVARMTILESSGVAAFRWENYPFVYDLAEQGLALSRRLGEPAKEASFLVNRGVANFHIGLDKAIRDHEDALSVAQATHNEHTQAAAHNALAIDYLALERFDDARPHLAEALRLFEALGQIHRAAKTRRLGARVGFWQDSANGA
jgi:hypothetical protein